MADKYVDPAIAASGTGGSWAQAYKTLKEATDAAAAGETIYFHNGTADVISADTTYTLATGVRVISTSDKVNEPPTTYASGATVDGTGTASVDITVTGVGAYFGVVLKVGNSTNIGVIAVGTGVNSDLTFDDCDFHVLGTAATSCFNVGTNASGGRKSNVMTNNCTFTWGSVQHCINIMASYKSNGDDFSAGATHPATLFKDLLQTSGICTVSGGDLSDIATVFETTPNPGYLALIGCKMKSGFTVYSSAAYGQPDVWMFDCCVSGGDEHYHLGHWNYLGSTVCITTKYCSNSGALYDGTNGVCWVVSSTANASRATPYISPWIDIYQGTVGSSVTPYIECMRTSTSSSADTAYKDTEVASRWEYKGTSANTIYTVVDDWAEPLDATGTAQAASALGAGDWVGESTYDSYFTLGPGAITPQEIGHIRAQIIVSLASVSDLYVDPKIRFA